MRQIDSDWNKDTDVRKENRGMRQRRQQSGFLIYSSCIILNVFLFWLNFLGDCLIFKQLWDILL